jgi:hypothetical protein
MEIVRQDGLPPERRYSLDDGMPGGTGPKR